jgi:assimilatory nitrate reductase catalytic subunit
MPNTCTIKTTCPYCGVGCGVEATLKDDRLIAVSGDKSHPANLGKLCVKGTALNETMGHHGRLLAPQIDGQQVDWPTAIDTVASKLTAIRQQYGPNAIAFYLSGQLLTEDYYVANKLAKGFIGTANVDTNSRLCMSSAVAAYNRAFGNDLVPCSYDDIDHCELLILTGSNAAWTHPVLYQRMVAAKQQNPNMKIVVIDPRRTASCDIADLHLAIAPGSDGFIFNGLLNYLASNKNLDHEYISKHTQGFDTALDAAAEITIEAVKAKSGISEVDIIKFYQWYAATANTISFYSMGINQSATGTDKCNAIINCHLATGRVGKIGAGPFSITGQPNAMGGREVGGLANILAAHMDYSADNVALVSEFWQTDSVNKKPGLKAVDLFDAVATGEIKAIWIMGTNPVVSMPNADKVKAALENCDTVIVSDCIEETDTTATANILLPATGWGEKSGTVTNSERRISRQRRLEPAAGQAKDDWWILTCVAKKMGFGTSFNYQTARDIFVEHAKLSGYKNNGKRLFNIDGLADLSIEEYEQLKPTQWPITNANSSGTERLFENGIFNTIHGKAQFIAITAQLPKTNLKQKLPNKSAALWLNTGRLRDQWHTMTRTGRAQRLLDHNDQAFAAINPITAKRLDIQQGELIRLSSSYGSIIILAKIDITISEDQVFTPIHWNDQYSGNTRIDSLVGPITDKISGQPELKYTLIEIQKISTPKWATILTRNKINCQEFIYWSVTSFNQNSAYLYQVALEGDFDWRGFISGNTSQAIAFDHFSNTLKGDERFICHHNQKLAMAIYCHQDQSELPKRTWLQSLFEKSLLGTSNWSMLTGEEYKSCNTSKHICSCFKVSEDAIINAISDGANTQQALGIELNCGTNCGSCIPELNELIRQFDNFKAA